MLKEEIRRILLDCGAVAVGFAGAGRVAAPAMERFDGWLREGKHSGMCYMENHHELREDPRLLLEGARTVISLAFPYTPVRERDNELPMISRYAYCPDYHDTLRDTLRRAILSLPEARWRICVDSAPIRERYWAQRAGIAFLGDNGAAIVPGYGSEIFLAELLTDLEIEPDEPTGADRNCGHCGRCEKACPTGALKDSVIDCDLCLSYLTIEHRGEWTDPRHIEAMHTPAGRHTLFGCDRCLRVCPHNLPKSGEREDLLPGVITLRAEEIMGMDKEKFARTFKGSSLKRAKLEGLRRNAENTLTEEDI